MEEESGERGLERYDPRKDFFIIGSVSGIQSCEKQGPYCYLPPVKNQETRRPNSNLLKRILKSCSLNLL